MEFEPIHTDHQFEASVEFRDDMNTNTAHVLPPPLVRVLTVGGFLPEASRLCPSDSRLSFGWLPAVRSYAAYTFQRFYWPNTRTEAVFTLQRVWCSSKQSLREFIAASTQFSNKFRHALKNVAHCNAILHDLSLRRTRVDF